ncbi:hypothetical protein TEK04_03985 [Klenkia sp. LSe6-5]|uniref:Heme peroxidase n=1 Tax=Klenkia sesuvii TaxID=3103137 RepID=A0ABU8DPX5_9ACTN
MTFDDDVTVLAAACRAQLGPEDTWTPPVGYPDSLALCVVDAVWSMGVRYGGVQRVVQRYLTARSAVGADGRHDGARDLLDQADRFGGAEAFATTMDNRSRTSTRSGILKADAVIRCARALVAAGIESAADLRSAPHAKRAAAETGWREVPGQRSGISWRYVLLLAGVPEVKPDRMITRFVAKATGSAAAPDRAAALVTSVAHHLEVDVRGLDHRIWRFESGRG